MTKKIYIFLTFALCLFAFAMISGCGKYITQYSAPVIIERYPVSGTGGVGSTETGYLSIMTVAGVCNEEEIGNGEL
jgi:hypothetical protein